MCTQTDTALFIVNSDDTWLTSPQWQEMVWAEVVRCDWPHNSLPNLRDIDLAFMGL